MTTEKPTIVAAASPEAAKRLAQRTDEPTDLGPASNPARAAAGWRRYGWPAAPAPTSARSVLDTVRKLLTLASDRGATEEEAASAAAAAQRLIAKHQLDTALLDASETNEEATKASERAAIANDPLSEHKKVVTWRGRLARGIADANGCRIYWDPGHGGTLLRVIGTPSRVAAVRQLYSWLAAEIDRLGSEAALGKGRSYGRSWRIGCASRVGERLVDAARKGRKDAERAALSSGASIVRVNAALATLDEARDDADRIAKTLGLRTTRAAPPRADGYHDGRKAGDRIRLSGHAALGRGSNGRLRGGS